MDEIGGDKPYGLYTCDDKQIIAHLPKGRGLSYIFDPFEVIQLVPITLCADTFVLPKEYLT